MMDHASPEPETAPPRLGFLGVGAIAEALLRGLLVDDAKTGWSSRIHLSRRSEDRVRGLVDDYPGLTVGDNQEVVDHSDWIFLCVLPEQAESVVRELEFSPDQRIVSVVAGHSREEVKQWTGINLSVARLIPLPPVEDRCGPLPVSPPCPQLIEFLKPLGTPIGLEDETQFSALSAASASMATFFQFVDQIAGWIQGQGLSGEAATTYATSMIHALASQSLPWDRHQLAGAAQECLTPGGLNEQVLGELQQLGWFEQLDRSLDRIARRLAQSDDDR